MGMSLDGYVADSDGRFDWSAPDDDVHRLANEQARQASAFLFGRRMFEVMEDFWSGAAERHDLPAVHAEFAQIYVATPRVVFSDTLANVPDGIRLVRRADARAAVERMKAEAEGNLDIGGAGLAASLIDLVDEFRMWVNPVAVGGGTPFLPAVPGVRRMRRLEARELPSGALYLRYERID